MKPSVLSALASVMLAVPSLASAAEYVIDAQHSSAQFSVKHLAVSNVRGELGKMSGTILFDEKDPSSSRVEATIDVTTINTREPQRDEHLRSGDFFHVAKYPNLVFKSKRVEKLGNEHYKVTGDLSLRGVTKEVVLDVEGMDTVVKDPWGNHKRGAVATTKLNRKDFGLTWNKVLEAGSLVVGDEVSVTLDLQLNQKQPESKAAPAK